MIVKAEGQSAQPPQPATPNTPNKQGTSGAPGTKNNTTSPKRDKNSFLEKYRIPIIATLSILIICIAAAIITVLALPKGNGNIGEGSSQSGSGEATTIPLTESEQEALGALSAVYSSDDPEATANELTPNLIEKINNSETPTADKFIYVMNLSEIYVNNQQYADAINLLKEALKDPYLDSSQRVNLLYKLVNVSRKVTIYDYEIEAIQQILDTPTDEDYSADEKTKIDEKYSKRLEEAKTLKEAQNENE